MSLEIGDRVQTKDGLIKGVIVAKILYPNEIWYRVSYIKPDISVANVEFLECELEKFEDIKIGFKK